MNHLPRILVGLLCSTPVLHAAMPSADELLMAGRYQEIVNAPDQPHDGVWAFARFHLVPGKAAYEAAKTSAGKGEMLGKFVLMQCHELGVGVRRDDKVRWQMNVELRESLLAKKKHSAVESYVLSFLSQANKDGVIHENEFKPTSNAYEVGGKPSREHLRDSADGGFAQAMSDVGGNCQQANAAEALKWYQKAADAGLAAGMKNLGFMHATGNGPAKNAVEAVKWTKRAATDGDIYAMVNMAAFYDRLHLEGLTQADAQEWVKKASQTGHSLGYFEIGLACLRATYGLPRDEKAGLAWLQKGADNGDAFALGQLAYFYQSGFGVQKNAKKAVEFGKAAWVQGNEDAAGTISQAIEDSPDGSGAKDQKSYWDAHAIKGGFAYAVGVDGRSPEILKELKAIDPFHLVVE